MPGPEYRTDTVALVDGWNQWYLDDLAPCADRARYVTSLASVVEPGGIVHLLAFSDKVPGDAGPRRVSQAEIWAAFADGWEVERIDDAFFEVRPDWVMQCPHAWLARILRTA